MEHLETQVSDLRSFLPGAPSSTASTSKSNVNSRPVANMAGAGVGPGAATATTQRHPSQSAGSSVSAVGSNSAHPSPLSFGPNHNAQPARNLNPSVSTPGAGPAPSAAAHGGGAAAAAGAKRKLSDTTPDDASQRQQRSKRNRVSTRLLGLISHASRLLEGI